MPLKFSEPPNPPPGAPEWMVTYADMVTLLLTMFVMLVSLSEINREGSYQDVVESMQNRFGQGGAPAQQNGNLRPRHNAMAALVIAARHLRDELLQPTVESAETGSPSARSLLTTIKFEIDRDSLSAEARDALSAIAPRITGKSGTIEIRSLATPDRLDRAVARAQACRSQLVALGIDPQIVKVVAAELEQSADSDSADPNGQHAPRVELYLLESSAPLTKQAAP